MYRLQCPVIVNTMSKEQLEIAKFKSEVMAFMVLFKLELNSDISLVRRAWCRLLHKSGRLYHFDDDAYEIFQDSVPDKHKLDDETCDKLNEIRDILYSDELFTISMELL